MLSLTKWRLLITLCGLGATAPSVFAQSGVFLNEILASNVSYVSGDGQITDWVELVNTTGANVDLSGASLTDDQLSPTKWSFPFGTSIPANGYIVVAFDSGRAGSLDASPFPNTGFSIKASGGTIYFYGKSFGTLLDKISFGAQIADYSIGRVGPNWKLCTPTPGDANVIVTQLSPATGLRVNEWMANPSSGNDWFELFNTGAFPVDMSGLFLTDTLTDKTLSPVPTLSFVGSGVNAFVQFTADGSPSKGPDHVAFSLKASGEAIGIFDAGGNQIDAVTFGAQGIDISEGRLPDGTSFRTTFPGTSSPGRSNFKDIPTIWVNEVLSHTDPPIEDAVEFYNNGDTATNIGGWFLSNKETELKKYRVPDGTTIPAHGYKVIYEGAFNGPSAISPFTFNSAHGDQVFLAQADAGGNLTGYRVSEVFESAEHGFSFGRVQTSIPGDYKFVALSSITFGVDDPTSVEQFRLGQGEPNALPKIGPIVLNEVHYNPPSQDGVTDNTDDEFIELYNITANAVNLFDPAHTTNHWRLQNGVNFVFPAGQVIPAFGYALLVSFDPVLETITAADFRRRWNVPASVKLYGPLLGNLNNSGDSLELYKPDPPQDPPHPDVGYVPYIRVDKVNYTDSAPWPTGADGLGGSLQRKNPRTFGNDPVNWASAAPTPGVANSADLVDSDGDGMTDVWEDANGFLKNDPSDAAQDADGDGFTNLQEFFAGTNPHDATSKLAFKRVVPAASDTVPLSLTFVAAPNKAYTVEYRSSLAINTSWQKLANVAAEATQHDVTVQDSGAWGKAGRYYRIVVQ